MGVGGDLFWLGGDGWGLVGMSGGRWGFFLARWGSVGVGGGERWSVGMVARFSKALTKWRKNRRLNLTANLSHNLGYSTTVRTPPR